MSDHDDHIWSLNNVGPVRSTQTAETVIIIERNEGDDTSEASYRLEVRQEALGGVVGIHYGAPLEQMLLEQAFSMSDRYRDVETCEQAILARRNWVLETVTEMLKRQESYEERARASGIC